MSNLADLDDAFETVGKPKPVAELPQPQVANGLYTIVFPCGTHKTLRIHTQRGGKLAGKRLVSLLVGPVNTDDYETVGELIPAPTGVYIWKRYQGKRTGEYVQTLWLMVNGGEVDGHELKVSKNCLRCNRPLTTPDSLARNIGPECEKRG